MRQNIKNKRTVYILKNIYAITIQINNNDNTFSITHYVTTNKKNKKLNLIESNISSIKFKNFSCYSKVNNQIFTIANKTTYLVLSSSNEKPIHMLFENKNKQHAIKVKIHGETP